MDSPWGEDCTPQEQEKTPRGELTPRTVGLLAVQVQEFLKNNFINLRCGESTHFAYNMVISLLKVGRVEGLQDM